MQTNLDEFNLLKDLQDFIRDLKLLRKKVYNKEAWRSNARSVLFYKYFDRNKELKTRYENMVAKVPMNKLMVKPIPHNNAIPYNHVQSAPSGIFANFDLTANQAAPKTPNCLPRNKPRAMPKGIG